MILPVIIVLFLCSFVMFFMTGLAGNQDKDAVFMKACGLFVLAVLFSIALGLRLLLGLGW